MITAAIAAAGLAISAIGTGTQVMGMMSQSDAIKQANAVNQGIIVPAQRDILGHQYDLAKLTTKQKIRDAEAGLDAFDVQTETAQNVYNLQKQGHQLQRDAEQVRFDSSRAAEDTRFSAYSQGIDLEHTAVTKAE